MEKQLKVTFPRMGHYTEFFEFFVKSLGHIPITPPKTSQKTIKLGVRHSSDMVCFPFKSTLGNLIEGLDKGANAIIVLGVNVKTDVERCRFLYYYHIQEQILKRLGYKFEMLWMQLPVLNIIRNFKQISFNKNYYQLSKIIKESMKLLKEIETKRFTFERKKINIGLVGEAYTLWEQDVNYNIIEKLKKMGVGVHLSISLSWFIKHNINLDKIDPKIIKELKRYFPKRIGGHGWESLYHTIKYAKEGFDGVIHLMPMTCMPESLIEMPMDLISEDYNLPTHSIVIDENDSHAQADTRLETFIKMLQRKKEMEKEKCI